MNAWVTLLRGLPVGENPMPKMTVPQYNAIKTSCYRENANQSERYYEPSTRKGAVTILVKERP